MTDVNEELTKKMADLEKTGKACNIKLNEMENWLQDNNVEIQYTPVSENVEEIALNIL